MGSKTWWLAVLGILGVVNAIVAVLVAMPQIEGRLKADATTALESKGLVNWKVNVSGRRVELVGPRPSPGQTQHPEESEAVSVIQKLERASDVVVRYPDGVAASRRQPESIFFAVIREGDRVSLSGQFNSIEQQEAMIQVLEGWFNSLNVDDASSVNFRRVTQLNPAKALEAQESWIRKTETFTLRYDGKVVRVQGPRQYSKQQGAVLNALRRAFPGTKAEAQFKDSPSSTLRRKRSA